MTNCAVSSVHIEGVMNTLELVDQSNIAIRIKTRYIAIRPIKRFIASTILMYSKIALGIVRAPLPCILWLKTRQRWANEHQQLIGNCYLIACCGQQVVANLYHHIGKSIANAMPLQRVSYPIVR